MGIDADLGHPQCVQKSNSGWLKPNHAHSESQTLVVRFEIDHQTLFDARSFKKSLMRCDGCSRSSTGVADWEKADARDWIFFILYMGPTNRRSHSSYRTWALFDFPRLHKSNKHWSCSYAGLLDFAAFIIWSAHATLVPVHPFHCSLHFLIFLWLLVPWDLGCAAEIRSTLAGAGGTPASMLALLIIQQAPEGGDH